MLSIKGARFSLCNFSRSGWRGPRVDDVESLAQTEILIRYEANGRGSRDSWIAFEKTKGESRDCRCTSGMRATAVGKQVKAKLTLRCHGKLQMT